jgi:hypothetical protein
VLYAYVVRGTVHNCYVRQPTHTFHWASVSSPEAWGFLFRSRIALGGVFFLKHVVKNDLRDSTVRHILAPAMIPNRAEPNSAAPTAESGMNFPDGTAIRGLVAVRELRP